ncbi:Dymeclin [Aphelenchoides avenae]|nr:Dymeclin [Aphelenchus avenae]
MLFVLSVPEWSYVIPARRRMGCVVSSAAEVAENELLARLAGTEPLSENDPYWNKLLSFNFNIDEQDRRNVKELFTATENLLQSFLYNAPTSGNFATFVRMFLRRSAELETSAKCENKIYLWHAANALLILRYICTFFSQRLSVAEFVKTFEPTVRTDDSPDESPTSEAEPPFENVAEEFLVALVDILVSLPVKEFTLALHTEAVTMCTVLLSTQLYEETVTENSAFLHYFMRLQPPRSTELIRVLLDNFLYHNAPLPRARKDSASESFVISFASSMWSALQKTIMVLPEDEANPTENPLAEILPPQSLGSLSSALLLSLSCYPSFGGRPNEYNKMLSLFQNAQEVSSLANLEASFKVDFTALYNRLCATVHEKLPMLLLYMLLHKNSGFRNFVLSRINLENLVMPVLQVLNEGICSPAFRSHSHQTYLALIVILILSEDDFFCKIVHETMVKNVAWFQSDRPTGEISLGGLIVLVFCKTIHMNTAKTRDRYLHTNSLAAMANMSSCFKHLSPHVCQKIIGLLETMTRRHSRMIQSMRDNAENEEPEEDYRGDDLHRDITALEEGIRTVLEIINACLCNNLRYNAQLIYCILYKRDLFELYHNHPMFQDLVWNIFMVINHFSTRVETSSSVSVVLDAIEKAAIQWPTDRLKKFPDLKYKYIEDENTVEFFVPYVWRLIYQSMYFERGLVKLFNVTNV